MKLKSFICVLGLLLVNGGLVHAQFEGLGKGVANGFGKGATKSFVKGTAFLQEVKLINRGFSAPFKTMPQINVKAPYLAIVEAPDSGAPIIKGTTSQGLSIQQMGDLRKIVFSDRPTLANNRKPEDMAIVFSVENGKSFLSPILEPYLERYPLHGAVIDGFTSYSYDQVLEDPGMWDIRTQVIGYTKIVGPTMEGFPRELTPQLVQREAPGLFARLTVLSLREYVAKHGFMFPSYINDEDLVATIHGIWRRLIADESTVGEINMLVQTYFYSLNAREIGEIVTETETFIRENGRFPGLKWLTLSPEETYAYTEAGGAGQLSPEKLDEITLGMQASLVAKGLPVCDWFWDTLPTELKMRINQLTLSMVAH